MKFRAQGMLGDERSIISGLCVGQHSVTVTKYLVLSPQNKFWFCLVSAHSFQGFSLWLIGCIEFGLVVRLCIMTGVRGEGSTHLRAVM